MSFPHFLIIMAREQIILVHRTLRAKNKKI